MSPSREKEPQEDDESGCGCRDLRPCAEYKGRSYGNLYYTESVSYFFTLAEVLPRRISQNDTQRHADKHCGERGEEEDFGKY